MKFAKSVPLSGFAYWAEFKRISPKIRNEPIEAYHTTKCVICHSEANRKTPATLIFQSISQSFRHLFYFHQQPGAVSFKLSGSLNPLSFMLLVREASASTQLFCAIKTRGCANHKLPLLLDKSACSRFGRAKSASRVPGRTARKHWVGVRRIKSTSYIHLIPTFSLKGEGAGTCHRYLCP